MDLITSDNTNLLELNNKIDSVIDNTLSNEFHFDLNNYKDLTNIKHSTFNYLMSNIYNSLFNPHNNTLINNQKSLLDYNDIILFDFLVNKFIELCQKFNKSVGLYGFGYMVGLPLDTISEWLSDEGKKLNPQRWRLLRNIQEGHKAQHISLLNDSGLGLIAVANNDTETGLNWAEKQQQTTATKEVYFLPSERIERLRITQQAEAAEAEQSRK